MLLRIKHKDLVAAVPMAGKLSKKRKTSMKLKYLLTVFLFLSVMACNNEATVQDGSDSATKVGDTSDQSAWPEARDIMGGDTVPSPETQADTSQSTRK